MPTALGSSGPIEQFINRVVLGLIAFAVLAAIISAAINLQCQLARSKEVERGRYESARVLELVALQKQVQLDVVQVQQFLTDVSATRGLNGLDDGWENAAKNARNFEADVKRASVLASELKADELSTALGATERQFKDYYSTGQKMAHAYVDQGPTGGNAFMPTFDATAEKMTKVMESASSATADVVTRSQESAAVTEAALSSRQQISVAVTVVAAILTAIGGFTVLLLMRRRLMRPLARLVDFMGVLANGRLSEAAPVKPGRDELGRMAEAIEVFRANELHARELKEQQESMRFEQEQLRLTQAERDARTSADVKAVVDGLAHRLQGMAKGDLDVNIDEFFPEQYKRLRMDFNEAVQELSGALGHIRKSSHAVAEASNQIAEGSNDLARRAEQQAATLEQTAAAHDEITATVNKTLTVAKEAEAMVISARASAQTSRGVMSDAVEAINSIDQASRQITQIIGVIDEIAFQTNLLALNAGVEAARAGDAGRGFAVVAMEVRALAQRSADAAKQIKTLISQSERAVSRGVDLVGATGATLHEIVDQVTLVADRVHEIAASAAEQSTGLEEVNKAISMLDTVTQQNAAVAEESSAACATLTGEAERLVNLVSRFSICGAVPSAQSYAA
jgi:methyl-accepting chemotaxis protein